MRAHIDAVAAALGSPAPQADPLAPLRRALQPRAHGTTAARAPRSARRLFTDLLRTTPPATRAPQRRNRRIE
jgi:hypothetical protein